MDKDKLIEKILKDPMALSEEEILEILQNPEMQRIYSEMCMVACAVNSISPFDDKDIDLEWQRFERRHFKFTFKRFVSQRKVAVIATVVFISIAAIGAAIGMMDSKVKEQKEFAGNSCEISDTAIVLPLPADEGAFEGRTKNEEAQVIFENATLETILEAMVAHYKCKVRFEQSSSKALRLYFKWDKSTSLPEVLELLNVFEQINLRLDADTIIVE